MATTDYYQQLLEVTTKQNQIDAFAKSLKSMAEGHQKLYENRNKMQAKEVKELLTGYASDIQDIISEFNKLKK
jgi:two-component sensor histidine kinase